MAKNGGYVHWKFKWDIDRNSYQNILKALAEVQKKATQVKPGGSAEESFKKAAVAAKQLQSIISSSWNDKLGQLNLNKFNQSIKSSFGSFEQFKNSLLQGGTAGQHAFNAISQSVLNTTVKLKQSNQWLDKMAQTMGNSLRWNIATRIFNTITGSVRSAYNYVKNLDTSLTNIRMVTGDSADEMQRFAKNANTISQSLGRSTLDYTDAAVSFYRQGLSDEQVAKRTEITLKAQNVTGTGSQMVDYLTSVWNGFKVEVENTQRVVDAMAKVADSSASSLSELATAMSKVSATANVMGVSSEQLTAQIATVVATTRQAPESVGTAFKTIYARLNDIETGAQDAQISLGNYSSKMLDVGINVLDANGKLRNTGDVIDQIGEKWQNLTREQQVYLARTMGGQRQITQVMALFENWGTYLELYNTALQSEGTLNQKNNIYLESTKATMKQLQTQAQRTYDLMFDVDTINDFTNVLRKTLTTFNDFLSGLGGGTNIFLHFGTVVAQVFNQQISNSIVKALDNFKRFKENLEARNLKGQVLQSVLDQTQMKNTLTGTTISTQGLRVQAQAAQKVYLVQKGLTQEQYNQSVQIQKQIGLKADYIAHLQHQIDKYRENVKSAQDQLKIHREDYETQKDYKEALRARREEELSSQEILKEHQELLNGQKKKIQDINVSEEERLESVIKVLQKESSILGLFGEETEEQKEQVEQLRKAFEDLGKVEGENVSHADALKVIYDAINGKVKDTGDNVKKVDVILKESDKKLERQKAKHEGILNTLEGQNNQYAEQGRRVINIQNATKGITTGLRIASSLISSFTQYSKQGATAADKANAAFSGVTGTLSAAAMAIPHIGFALSGVITAAGGLLKNIFGDQIEQLFKKAKDRVDELNQSIQKANQLTAEHNQTINSLQNVEKEWEKLSQKAGEYGRYLNTLTEEERDRYHEIAELIADKNQKAIAGYDEQGRAIVRNNNALRETIDLLQQQYQMQLQKDLGGSFKAFAKNEEATIESYRQAYQEAQKEATKQITGRDRTGNETDDPGFNGQIDYTAGRIKALMTRTFGNSPSEKQIIQQRIAEQLGKEVNFDQIVKKVTTTTDPLQFEQAVKDFNDYRDSLVSALQKGFQGQDYSSFISEITASKNYFDNYMQQYQSYIDKVHVAANDLENYGKLNASHVLYGIKAFYKDEESYKNLFSYVDENEANALLKEFIQTRIDRGEQDVEEIERETMEYANTVSSNFTTLGKYVPKLAYNTETTILENIQQRKKDLETFLSNLDGSDYQDPALLSALQTFIQDAFGFSKINLSNSGRDIFATSIQGYADEDNVRAAVTELQNNIPEIIKKIDRSEDGSEALFRLIADEFKSQELQDLIDTYADQINWEYVSGVIQKQGSSNVKSALITGLKKGIEQSKRQLNGIDTEQIKFFNEATSKLLSGKTLEHGKDGQEGQAQQYNQILNKIRDKYKYLEDDIKMISDANVQHTQAWSDALARVGKALDEMLNEDLAQTLSEYHDVIPELSIDIDDESLQKYIDKVENFIYKDYQLSINIHSDAEDQFEKLSTEMENIYAAAGKIGQNFVVSANDLRQLNNVFPGIIEGIQYVDDGYAQLNEDVVQGAIAAAQGQIAADSESVVGQLKNQATLLHTKARVYNDMADAAQALAKTQTDSSINAAQQQQIITDGLARIKDLAAQETAENEMQAQSQVADNSLENAKATASNWQLAGTKATNAMYEFATRAIMNFRQVAKGAEGKIDNLWRGTIATGFTGVGGTSQDVSLQRKAEIDISSITSSEEWEQLSQEFRRLAQSNEHSANDIDGMVAQVAARMNQLGTGFGNISAGKGVNPKDQKQKTSKEKEAKSMDYLKEQFDRYHDIDLIIKAISKDLEKVTQEQKKLAGKALVDNLNQQVGLLNQQISAYETKIALAKQEQLQLQASLAAQGVMFDSNTGAISNYASVLQGKLNAVNGMISYYNTLSAEQQQGYKDIVEQAKKDYEQFKKQISNYDKLISDTIPGLEKDIRSARDKIVEKQIQKFKMSVQIELDLSKAERDWNKFRKTVIQRIGANDILGNTKSKITDFSSYYNDTGAGGQVQALTSQVNAILAELAVIDNGGSSSVYGTDKAAAVNDLKNYYTQLMSSLESVQSSMDEVNKAFLTQIQSTEKAFSQQVQYYNLVGEVIEHDRKLIQMLYGEQSYAQMANYYEQQRQNDNTELDFMRQQKEFWQARRQESLNRLSELEQGSKEWETESERLAQIEKNWVSSIKDLNSKVQDSVQHLLDKYTNTVNQIFDDLGKKLTNGQGLDYVGQEWQLINKQADQYLDTVNAMAEIQNFENAAQEAINNSAGNLKNQRAINKLAEEQLKILKTKQKLTQYDVDRANKLLQIEIKRQAVEQARLNKSQLRLRRDSQGNYSYQYTANQDELLKAQKEFQDAQVDLYNFDREQYKNNLDEMYSLQNQFFSKLKDLYLKYPEWTDEAEAERQMLVEYYGRMINDKTEQNQGIRMNLASSTVSALTTMKENEAIQFGNLQAQKSIAAQNQANSLKGITAESVDRLLELYQKSSGDFKNMTETEKQEFNGLMGTLVPQWDSSLQQMSDKINDINRQDSLVSATSNGLSTIISDTGEALTTLDGQVNGFLTLCQGSLTSLDQANNDYKGDVEELQRVSGISFGNIKTGIDENITALTGDGGLIKSNEELISKYQNENTEITKLIQNLGTLAGKYGEAATGAKNAAQAAYKYWQQLQRQQQAAANTPVPQTTPVSVPQSTPTSTPTTPTASSGGSGNAGGSSGSGNAGGSSGGGDVGQTFTPVPQEPIQQTAPTETKREWHYDDKIHWATIYYSDGTRRLIAEKGPHSWQQTSKTEMGPTTQYMYSCKCGATKRVIKYNNQNGREAISVWNTGGYTGTWNSNEGVGKWANNGKLAVLHQKELVLNQTDTANMLSAVSIVRTMQDSLKSIAGDYSLPQILSNFSGGNSTSLLDQNVHITASFPAVNSHFEIEQAFSNLINRASQYALRR